MVTLNARKYILEAGDQAGTMSLVISPSRLLPTININVKTEVSTRAEGIVVRDKARESATSGQGHRPRGV